MLMINDTGFNRLGYPQIGMRVYPIRDKNNINLIV